jgi:hypothetical protein
VVLAQSFPADQSYGLSSPRKWPEVELIAGFTDVNTLATCRTKAWRQSRNYYQNNMMTPWFKITVLALLWSIWAHQTNWPLHHIFACLLWLLSMASMFKPNWFKDL